MLEPEVLRDGVRVLAVARRQRRLERARRVSAPREGEDPIPQEVPGPVRGAVVAVLELARGAVLARAAPLELAALRLRFRERLALPALGAPLEDGRLDLRQRAQEPSRVGRDDRARVGEERGAQPLRALLAALVEL